MDKNGDNGPIRILVLSEFPVMAWGLARIIEHHGPSLSVVGVATTLPDAMTAQINTAPDIAIIDLDCEHATKSIQTLAAAGRGLVMVLTASKDESVHDSAVLAGANGVVKKTEPLEVLLKAIERIHQGEFWVDHKAVGRIIREAVLRQAVQARDPEHLKIARLTRKERLTVSEVARDASATLCDIAMRLCISQSTLRNHLTSIYSKLGLRNRLELHAYVAKHHIYHA
jgi:DNA-binding NarL/FixJ family response regulator